MPSVDENTTSTLQKKSFKTNEKNVKINDSIVPSVDENTNSDFLQDVSMNCKLFMSTNDPVVQYVDEKCVIFALK